MKEKWFMKARKLVVVLSLLALTLSLAACSSKKNDASPSNSASSASSSTPSSSPSAEPPKPVTLTVFSMLSQKSGLQENWFTNILKEKYGISIDLIPTGNSPTQKLQTLMASGEFPDVVIFQDPKSQVGNAVKANLLLNLDEHLDKLPNVVKNASTSLQYYRDQISAGTGKAYAVPGYVGPSFDPENPPYGPSLRWDLYKKAGSPQIATLEDYLPLVKKMQELEPKTPDGKKVYGFTFWTDWDSATNTMYLATDLGNTMGYGQLGFNQSNSKTGELEMSILDPNSTYIRILKFYNEAYKMGLVDPDSVSQKFEAANAKATEGRTLFHIFPWGGNAFNTPERVNASEPIGYMPIFSNETKIGISDVAQPIGTNYAIAVGASTKNVDAALQLVDYLYSEEGAMTLHNGPQGVTWDVDASGTPVVTDAGWDYIDNGKDLPGGGKVGDKAANEGGVSVLNFMGLTPGWVTSDYNTPAGYKFWASSQGRNQTNLQKDWSNVMGAKNPVQYLFDKKLKYSNQTFGAFMPPVPDDITALTTQVGSVIIQDSWKMVFSKNQADFDKFYKDMVDKAAGLGIDKVNDFWKNARVTAIASEQKYK